MALPKLPTFLVTMNSEFEEHWKAHHDVHKLYDAIAGRTARLDKDHTEGLFGCARSTANNKICAAKASFRAWFIEYETTRAEQLRATEDADTGTIADIEALIASCNHKKVSDQPAFLRAYRCPNISDEKRTNSKEVQKKRGNIVYDQQGTFDYICHIGIEGERLRDATMVEH